MDPEHYLLLELLRVIRTLDGGACLIPLLFDRPQEQVDVLLNAIREVGGPGNAAS